jgi:ubiquinone/menaquinone biosynthesis C-methylase UbiE
MTQMQGSEFDRHAANYSSAIEETIGVFGQSHDFYVRHKAILLKEAFDRLPARPKVLDVGCGIGLVHSLLKPLVSELHGVDVSAASIETARNNNADVRYQAYDGHKLPYGDAEFDAAFAICVMHHVPVPEWPAFGAEMARVVKPGGLLIVIEHNPANPATQWVVRNSPLDENAVLVQPRKLRGILQASGVESIATRFVLFTPFEGGIFRKLDGVLRAVPLGAQYMMSGTRSAT